MGAWHACQWELINVAFLIACIISMQCMMHDRHGCPVHELWHGMHGLSYAINRTHCSMAWGSMRHK